MRLCGITGEKTLVGATFPELFDNAPFCDVLEGVNALTVGACFARLAAVLHNSDLFLGGIGALMHLARGVRCRSVIAYSLSEPLETASYPCNRNLSAARGCSHCRENMLNPAKELEECRDNFSCIRTIEVKEVCAAVDEMMRRRSSAAWTAGWETERVDIAAGRPSPLNALTARLFAMAQGMSMPLKKRTSCP